MTGPLTYTFPLDPAETVRVQRILTRRTRWGRFSPVLVGIGAFLVAFLAAILRWPLEALIPFLGVVVALGALGLLQPIVQRWRIRRAYEATPTLQGPQTYRFTQQGLVLKNALASSELRWGAILEAVETPEFFLFYFSKGCAYYLPRRVVGDTLEQDRLRDFVRLHVGDRATGLAAPELHVSAS